jgi:hypothetical protein
MSDSYCLEQSLADFGRDARAASLRTNARNMSTGIAIDPDTKRSMTQCWSRLATASTNTAENKRIGHVRPGQRCQLLPAALTVNVTLSGFRHRRGRRHRPEGGNARESGFYWKRRREGRHAGSPTRNVEPDTAMPLNAEIRRGQRGLALSVFGNGPAGTTSSSFPLWGPAAPSWPPSGLAAVPMGLSSIRLAEP